jgi:signal transduction histidine kinase
MTPHTQAELSQIVGKAAHDLKNLLAIILGNAELLEEDAADEATAQMLRLILDAAERGTQLANDLVHLVADEPEAG